jgi:hypothetical protein
LLAFVGAHHIVHVSRVGVKEKGCPVSEDLHMRSVVDKVTQTQGFHSSALISSVIIIIPPKVIQQSLTLHDIIINNTLTKSREVANKVWILGPVVSA